MLDIRVASPCNEKWESMSGDERKRFCAKCQLHVHNIASLTEAEVLALFKAEPGGRVCGRVFRRADNTVLFADCPVGLARVRRRIALVVTAAVALVLAAFGLRPSRSCNTQVVDADELPLRERVQMRFVDAKEWLRETETFGALIDKIDPLPPTTVTAGVIALPPTPPTPTPTPE